jgi:hypothetical protein
MLRSFKSVNVFETAIPVAKMYADMGAAQALNETLRTGPNPIPSLNALATSSKSPQSGIGSAWAMIPLKLSRVVYYKNVSVNEVHEELNETKLLSEINEHLIFIDTYGRATGVRTSPGPIEALALIMVMIVDETDIPMDGIVKGNEPTIMSEMGILMDLGQVVNRCTTSAASTVQASSVMANVFEPDVPMASDLPTTEVDADAISLPTTPESRSGRTTTRIGGLEAHRVYLPKSET